MSVLTFALMAPIGVCLGLYLRRRRNRIDSNQSSPGA